MKLEVRYGIDQFLSDSAGNRNLRWAMVTNDAARTSEGLLSRMALIAAGFTLKKLFSPEHGIHVTGVDGMYQQDIRDAASGLPVISLYGDKMQPSAEDLQDVDGVLYDIPDVGCRFYTYLWTLTYVMEACARFSKPLFVLDRPNPAGGLPHQMEGPMLDELHCSSFIGRWNIPLRHACTMGELALHFQSERMPGLALTVIPVSHYRRHYIAGRDFTFTPTSPAIRDPMTALMYPGSGLWEGIYINEGRGTQRPFLQCGAPWMNAEALAPELNKQLTGAEAHPVTYVPEESIYKGELCKGLSFEITDPDHFRSVYSGLLILKAIMLWHPANVRPRAYKTHANPSGERHLDLLLGVPDAWEKLMLQDPDTFTAVKRDWIDHRHLLYR